LLFNNLAELDKEHRKEVRKLFIKKFNCDESKASEETLISIENKPHFKSNKICEVVENKEGYNTLNQIIIQEAKENLTRYEDFNKEIDKDEDFREYHLKDPFFNYIKNTKIGDGTQRNNVLFKKYCNSIGIKKG